MLDFERRIIYFLVIVAISVPLLFDYSVKPAPLVAAEKVYDLVEDIDPKAGIALVALDYGPNTKAESDSQARVLIEHLMRRRIPIALFSVYPHAEVFLSSSPQEVAEKLMRENPGQTWEYGKDWVNLGYRPGSMLFVEAFAKSDDFVSFLGKDATEAKLSELAVFDGVESIEDISLLAQFTGLTGVFDWYVQFFRTGEYSPPFAHGCTSITIPEAYIYLDSGQLAGLFEGIAGAAWYSELLHETAESREPDAALIINTALGIAHLVIILLIVVGNAREFWQRKTVFRKGGL